MVSTGGFHMLKGNTHRTVGVALFGALAFVLMFFAFPIIPAFSYLKVDFSDLPLLLSYLLYGPIGGILSGVVRSILHYIQTGGDMGYPIGDVASFLASIAYCYPVYLLIRRAKSNKGIIAAFVAGTISLTIVLSIANWFVITPLYIKLLGLELGNLRTYLVAGIIPFNILKGIIISSVFMVILPKLKPWLVRVNRLQVMKKN